MNRAATPSYRREMHVLAPLVAVFWLSFGVNRGSAAENYVATALKITDDFRADLEELAGWCDERSLVKQAEKTRGWVRPRDPDSAFRCRFYLMKWDLLIRPRAPRPMSPPGTSSSINYDESKPAITMHWHARQLEPGRPLWLSI